MTIKTSFDIFKSKRILVTGHTGFKGSWLSTWLAQLGANVIGVSDRIPTDPAHYDMVKEFISEDHQINITDTSLISSIIADVSPQFIFHLAAQPIVLESYENPLHTFNTNVMGTANILDAIRISNQECTVIIITSDKCYYNVEWTYGYRETDRLGGKDPYSGSKAAAEMVIHSYVESFFKKSDSKIRVAVGRAGNVIGGGDWAPYRIVPDCVRSWTKNEKPEIRSPHSTRPWQHVLEPLSGYMTLAVALNNNLDLNGETFNFGPPASQNHSVEQLVNEIIKHWPSSKWVDKLLDSENLHEAGLLKLNCDKALHSLGWQAILEFKETAKWTADWYRTFCEEGPQNALKLTIKQIEKYMKLSGQRGNKCLKE